MSTQFTVDTFDSVDGTSLRYGLIRATSGEAEGTCPIVFVPGLGGTVKYAIPFLEKFVPDHGPVYSLDARGFGLNEGLHPQPNPGDYLKDFHQFVQHLQQRHLLNGDCPPMLMGLSLGGVYTTLYVTEREHPFCGMVLLAPAFCPHPTLFTRAFKLRNYFHILTRGLGAMTTLPYGVRDLTRNTETYEDPHFQEPLTLPAFYLFLVERLCNRAFNRLCRITLPTAVVIPELDRVCNPETMKAAYDQIPHAQKALFTYPELFHDVVQEPEPDRTILAGDLNRWFTSLRPVSRQHVRSHQ